MPMINVKITREGATPAQKKQVMAEMTEVLARVLGKNPETTIVIIEEVETENWGKSTMRNPLCSQWATIEPPKGGYPIKWGWVA